MTTYSYCLLIALFTMVYQHDPHQTVSFPKMTLSNTGHYISKLYKNGKKEITSYLHEATKDWRGKHVIFPLMVSDRK